MDYERNEILDTIFQLHQDKKVLFLLLFLFLILFLFFQKKKKSELL